MKAIALWLGLFCSFSAQAALTIEQWQTPKGARVWFAHAPQLPMVDVRMVFDAGSARDGELKGVASMTSELIGMGDRVNDEETFTQATEALGVQFSTSALKDMAVVNLRSLTRPDVLQPALMLASQALTYPSFLEQVLKRQQAQTLTALKAKQQSPGTVATERFWQKLYGNHPYASPSDGTEASVKSLTVADLKAFHQQYYVANNAVVAIVGALTRAQAEMMAIQLTDGLPAGQKATALPEVAVAAPDIESIAFKSQQTQIVMGQLGVKRGDPDYPALYLANHILGGSGFASRLMEEVREKRGLVYGVGSSLSPMRQTGPWMVSLKTANSNTTEAMKVVQETVLGMLKDIPATEIETHKDNIIGGFALETDSNKDIVGYLAMMAFYGLPVDWLDSFPQKIKAIDQTQLMATIQRHLKPQWWTGVVLGNPSQQTAPVQVLSVPAPTGHH